MIYTVNVILFFLMIKLIDYFFQRFISEKDKFSLFNRFNKKKKIENSNFYLNIVSSFDNNNFFFQQEREIWKCKLKIFVPYLNITFLGKYTRKKAYDTSTSKNQYCKQTRMCEERTS